MIRVTLLSSSLITCGVLLQGCAGVPERHAAGPHPLVTPPEQSGPSTVGNEIAMRALAFLGAPYEFGGNGPTTFDCSGLVRFIHGQIGIAVPRTADEQYRAANPVAMSALEPGDLLFFRIHGRISHVAIYAGEGRFIHAPQTGRPVELRPLDDAFYRPKLAGAGRLF